MERPEKVLSWYAQLVHDKHRLRSGEQNWADCGYWPCEPLQQAVLKGTPAAYVETDGAGTY